MGGYIDGSPPQDKDDGGAGGGSEWLEIGSELCSVDFDGVVLCKACSLIVFNRLINSLEYAGTIVGSSGGRTFGDSSRSVKCDEDISSLFSTLFSLF